MKNFILLIIIISNFILSSCFDFKLTGPPDTVPIITGIMPDSVRIGDTVIIYGSGFDFIQGGYTVTFNTVQAPDSNYLSWSDSEIKVIVPWTLSGMVYVETNHKSNGIDYIIKPNLHLPVEYGTVRDIDGNTYKTVKIRNQWWMAENLKVSHYRNGSSIPETKDSIEWDGFKTGAWCYYNNNPDTGKIYGKLYNGYAVNDPRGLAPSGWHVASDTDWTELENGLGGENIAGAKLKEAGSVHWNYPNIATDECGFSALPGGVRDGVFYGLGFEGVWWTSTEEASRTWLWLRRMDCGTYIWRFNDNKVYGFSVRCVKD
jgi:uncharacterized protein (TIGR02145 family)